jgi:hypothetical protein
MWWRGEESEKRKAGNGGGRGKKGIADLKFEISKSGAWGGGSGKEGWPSPILVKEKQLCSSRIFALSD